MNRRFATCCLLLLLRSGAAPIAVEPFSGESLWTLPGGVHGIDLAPMKFASVEVTVPDFTDKEREVGGKWRGILWVDAYGTREGKGTRRNLHLTGLNESTKSR